MANQERLRRSERAKAAIERRRKVPALVQPGLAALRGADGLAGWRRTDRRHAYARQRCAMVGEIKKGRYVYYHCTGYKQKCPEPYTREQSSRPSSRRC